jgi:hypothetical protein
LTNREVLSQNTIGNISDGFYDFPRWFASQAQTGGFFFKQDEWASLYARGA